jgi:hypothetical protein
LYLTVEDEWLVPLACRTPPPLYLNESKMVKIN